MKLKPDKVLRDRWFVPEAMSHPAKGHLGLWWELFERYTKPGQWVLDPMAGIGSSMIGAMMGRNVICNEMEGHFIVPMEASWAKMRQQAMLGCEMGQVVIIQGDARCLPLGRADVVVTSPPWHDTGNSVVHIAPDGKDNSVSGQYRRGLGWRTGQGYTRPAAIVTSPPYEGIVNSGEGPGASGPASGMWQGPNGYSSSNPSYTRPAAVITSPPYEGTRSDGSGINNEMVDAGFHSYTRPAAVITSPPYENSAHEPGNLEAMREKMGELYPGHIGPNSLRNGTQYSRDATNIGNLRGEKYWEAMRLVYAECHRVLAPGGVMVLVLKGYTRDGQYIDLPQQTVDECEALGFRLRERWARELWNLSFWRILQKRRDPEAFDERLRFEPVLVLEKG